jgi:D-alanyl-D-alanine-carboxypeptidase/D-alanyl-D-alanine-endopeptidase
LLKHLVESAARDGHVAIVAGVVEGDGVTTAAAGPAGGHTLFRIASLSKLFTGTALALAVVRGELSLDLSVRAALPARFGLPADPFDAIRLEHLATHRSGLPRGLDVAPDCAIEEYARALARTKPVTAPGTSYAYSNLGAQLVGMALRSTLPAQPDIVEQPNEEQQARTTSGHDEFGKPCETPVYPLGVASGGLYGSAEALLHFAQAHWTTTDPQLEAALALATEPRADAGEGNRIGLFWHIGAVPDGDGLHATWHNGSLPGYRSFLGIQPGRRRGVVVLSNTAKPVDAIGAKLLAGLAASG